MLQKLRGECFGQPSESDSARRAGNQACLWGPWTIMKPWIHYTGIKQWTARRERASFSLCWRGKPNHWCRDAWRVLYGHFLLSPCLTPCTICNNSMVVSEKWKGQHPGAFTKQGARIATGERSARGMGESTLDPKQFHKTLAKHGLAPSALLQIELLMSFHALQPFARAREMSNGSPCTADFWFISSNKKQNGAAQWRKLSRSGRTGAM